MNHIESTLSPAEQQAPAKRMARYYVDAITAARMADFDSPQREQAMFTAAIWMKLAIQSGFEEEFDAEVANIYAA